MDVNIFVEAIDLQNDRCIKPVVKQYIGLNICFYSIATNRLLTTGGLLIYFAVGNYYIHIELNTHVYTHICLFPDSRGNFDMKIPFPITYY